MTKVIDLSKTTEEGKVVGRTFTIKAQPHQIFDPGEVYQFDYEGPKAAWDLKCKCLEYLTDKDEYRFKVVEAKKQ
jgi:hypothetical protein